MSIWFQFDSTSVSYFPLRKDCCANMFNFDTTRILKFVHEMVAIRDDISSFTVIYRRQRSWNWDISHFYTLQLSMFTQLFEYKFRKKGSVCTAWHFYICWSKTTKRQSITIVLKLISIYFINDRIVSSLIFESRKTNH
jgi:hypothetical protein